MRSDTQPEPPRTARRVGPLGQERLAQDHASEPKRHPVVASFTSSSVATANPAAKTPRRVEIFPVFSSPSACRETAREPSRDEARVRTNPLSHSVYESRPRFASVKPMHRGAAVSSSSSKFARQDVPHLGSRLGPGWLPRDLCRSTYSIHIHPYTTPYR